MAITLKYCLLLFCYSDGLGHAYKYGDLDIHSVFCLVTIIFCFLWFCVPKLLYRQACDDKIIMIQLVLPYFGILISSSEENRLAKRQGLAKINQDCSTAYSMFCLALQNHMKLPLWFNFPYAFLINISLWKPPILRFRTLNTECTLINLNWYYRCVIITDEFHEAEVNSVQRPKCVWPTSK